jgi:hypothetical protein
MTSKPDRDEERVGGMRTLEQRIEAVAAWLTEMWGVSNEADTLAHRRWEARSILKRAFPELFSDPPGAWLAPWELDRSALTAGWPHFATFSETPDGPLDFAERRWAALRAHLNPNRSEGDG